MWGQPPSAVRSSEARRVFLATGHKIELRLTNSRGRTVKSDLQGAGNGKHNGSNLIRSNVDHRGRFVRSESEGQTDSGNGSFSWPRRGNRAFPGRAWR